MHVNTIIIRIIKVRTYNKWNLIIMYYYYLFA